MRGDDAVARVGGSGAVFHPAGTVGDATKTVVTTDRVGNLAQEAREDPIAEVRVSRQVAQGAVGAVDAVAREVADTAIADRHVRAAHRDPVGGSGRRTGACGDWVAAGHTAVQVRGTRQCEAVEIQGQPGEVGDVDLNARYRHIAARNVAAEAIGAGDGDGDRRAGRGVADRRVPIIEGLLVDFGDATACAADDLCRQRMGSGQQDRKEAEITHGRITRGDTAQVLHRTTRSAPTESIKPDSLSQQLPRKGPAKALSGRPRPKGTVRRGRSRD